MSSEARVSICTATVNPSITSRMVQSAIAKLSNISEIILANNEREFTEEVNGVLIRGVIASGNVYDWCPHIGGLHEALKHATGTHIYFCDDDIVFQSDVTKLYLTLLDSQRLGIVGISHYQIYSRVSNPIWHAYGYFPVITNCLVKRDSLPDASFLKSKLRIRSWLKLADAKSEDEAGDMIDGMFLAASPIPEYARFYPYPSEHFQIGHNLWLWYVHFQKADWLAFQTLDEQHYWQDQWVSSSGNVSLDLPHQPLLWHKTGHGRWEQAP